MADKFDRFTRRARRILTLAQEEAQRLNHNYIGTEHILLGLTREENGVAVRVLQELQIDLAQVRDRVERTVGRGQKAMYGKLSLTPRSKRVIELAMDEARRLGHHYIGTEHLLLGIVREGEGIAVDALKASGVSLDKVRTQTERVMMEASSRTRTNSPARTPLLDRLMARDITQLALAGKLDPVIEQATIVNRVIEILLKLKLNSPLIVGPPGVGKTAMIYALAQRIATSKISPLLQHKRIVELDLGTFFRDAKSLRDSVSSVQTTFQEIRDADDVILLVDHLDRQIADRDEDSQTLQMALIRGDIQMIGVTTVDAYETYFKSSALWHRIFTPVFVKAPSTEETIDILQQLGSEYEHYYQIEIPAEMIEAVVHFSDQYFVGQYQPHKALSLLDAAGALLHMSRSAAQSDTESQTIPKLEHQHIMAGLTALTGLSKDDLGSVQE